MILHLRRYFTLGLLLCAPVLADGPARLVADFVPGTDPVGFALSDAATLGNRVVFLGPDPEHYPMLWTTDGTPDGTRALAALCPACDGVSALGSTGSVAFYRTNRSAPNAELRIWRTDGTQAGTFPVLTTPGNPALSSINGGLLFFVACTPAYGCEVWLSDGTVAGTRPAGDIVPGPANGDIRQITAAGDRAFVISGSALWAADGSGVRRLLEFSKMRALFADRGRAFFIAEVGGEFEVWTSDGTVAGTRAVTSFGPKNPLGRYPFARLVEGRLYFAARPGKGTDLWSVGATRESLRRLTDFHDPTAYFNSVRKAGNRSLIVAQRQSGPQTLWVSRGDSRSTALLTGCPGGCPEVQSELAPLGQGRFVFKGRGKSGEALWVTDGTGPGTRELQSTGRYHDLAQYATVGDRILFELTNEYETGELWLTDGTPAGTFFLAPGGPRWSHYWGWGGPLVAAKVNRTILFSAFPGEDEPYQILMTSDGSPGGMRELTRFTVGKSSYPQELMPLGDRLLVQTCSDISSREIRAVHGTETAVLFSRPYESYCGSDPLSYRHATLNGRAAFLVYENPLGNRLLATDGTPAGTVTLIPSTEVDEPIDVVRFGDRFAIWMIHSTGPSEWVSQLWTSDGTPAGTGRLLDLPIGTDMLGMAAFGGKLYFFDLEPALNNKYRMRPWVSDGTAAGTHALTSVDGTTPEDRFVELDGRVYFRFTPEGAGTEIWSTDGTPAGTGPAVSAASSGLLQPLTLTAAGGRLYFQARRVAKGPILPWVSDGTDAGTMPLADVTFEDPGDLYYQPSALSLFVELDGRVYFGAADPEHGDELWSTDGTPAGTRRVKDIAPGQLGSYPRSLVAWNGRLWFRAREIAHGLELWTSDGTAEGTTLVDDVAAGPSSSTPRELTATGEGLYFSAHDGEHGRELWELPASELDLP